LAKWGRLIREFVYFGDHDPGASPGYDHVVIGAIPGNMDR